MPIRSIRTKVAAVIVVVLLLIVILALTTSFLVATNYEVLERDFVRQDVDQVANGWANQIASLGANTRDYALWNLSFNYVTEGDPDYLANSLGGSLETLNDLNIDFVVISNAAGEVLFSGAYDFETDDITTPPDGLESLVAAATAQIDAEPFDNEGNVSGFYRTDDQLLLTSSYAISSETLDSDFVGVFTFGRIIDETDIAALSEQLHLNTGILLDVTGLTANDITVIPQNDQSIVGMTPLQDINGEPIGALRVEVPRNIYAQGQSVSRLLLLVALITGATIAFVSLASLESLVISPITVLSAQVDELQNEQATSRRVDATRNDEISLLSRNINKFLTSINQAQDQLMEKNRALTAAYERAQEATQLKSAFISTMSHELRTPLNAIIGYSGIMIEGISGEVDDEALRMINNISASSTHLLNLVNDILDLSKIEAGRLEIVEDEFALRGLLDELMTQMQILAAKKHIKLEAEIAAFPFNWFLGDSARLKQVLTNLISNAIKFTERGTVTVRVMDKTPQVLFEVEDTGIGIPAHALSYIFEEFRQVDNSSSRNYEGTGLGLAITQKLVTSMGGSITVESKLGEGSTFRVLLPLQPAPHTEPLKLKQ